MSNIQMLGGWTGLVPSDIIGREPYLVDLISYQGMGKCTCHDYEIRCQKNRKEGKTDEVSLRCKHIRRLREHCMDVVTQSYIIQQKQQLKERIKTNDHGQS